MSRYCHYYPEHAGAPRVGVLLVNLGTPEAATTAGLRRYLAEFLWDPRVVELPRWLWWWLLQGVILPIRPRRSARAYQKIWTSQGSPLLSHSVALCQLLQQTLATRLATPPRMGLAMRYGRPAIADVLRTMQQDNVDRLLVLPLYPQYSATTTASVFDAVSRELQAWRRVPELRFIHRYHDFSPYINALAASVRQYWQRHDRGQMLLMSFHGIPKRNQLLGDPYFAECQKTAHLLAAALQLKEDEYRVGFQSRFGKAEWLQPYTDKILQQLPTQGIQRVDVICPGFAVDCLETLEEIAEENRDYFLHAGGEAFHYIPALNAMPEHANALCDLIQLHLQGWESGAG